MIAVIDLQMGNLGSIMNMFKKIGAPAYLASSPADLENANKVVLPGVGAFDHGVKQLRSLGFYDYLPVLAKSEKKQILGICLGMQLLTKCSEEGEMAGLGIIDAETRRFHFDDPSLKIPHMGWNTVICCKSSRLTRNFPTEPRFYFVHSYFVNCSQSADVLFTASYGTPFVAGFESNNVFGVQFHPEKSHRFGMKIFENFVSL